MCMKDRFYRRRVPFPKDSLKVFFTGVALIVPWKANRIGFFVARDGRSCYPLDVKDHLSGGHVA